VDEHDALNCPAHAVLLVLALQALDPGGDAGVLLRLSLLLAVSEVVELGQWLPTRTQTERGEMDGREGEVGKRVA
jgi:hypothetical protein